MKRLITLVSLVLLTFPSLSQTSIRTPSSDSLSSGVVSKEQLKRDSLVAIPKTYVIWMAQDMARSRSYAQEIATLNDRVGLKERIIVQQDTIIEAYKGKLKTYMKLYDSCNDANSAYEADIANLKRDVRIQKAQKKFWKYTAIVVPIVVGGFVHLHWKFGH